MLKTDGLIFDLDGTLWDSVENVTKSWNVYLKKTGSGRVLGDEEMQACFGLPMPAIVARLFPEADAKEQQVLLDGLIREENAYIYEHGGKLYPGLEETLRELKGKVRLSIVSNCQCGYIEAFLHAHRMDRYFDDFESWGNTGEMKDANIRRVVSRDGLKVPVYVGDIQGDCDAAHRAGVPFVHAAYGFGEVKDPEEVIRSFGELLNVISY